MLHYRRFKALRTHRWEGEHHGRDVVVLVEPEPSSLADLWRWRIYVDGRVINNALLTDEETAIREAFDCLRERTAG
jgi:hypothetical protein